MKKVMFLVVAMATFMSSFVMAEVPISKNDKVSPVDEIWMDMATGLAKDNKSEGGKPCGTVVVFNGALKSVGVAADGATSVEAAIISSRLGSLENAVIYTVNEPTAEAYNIICHSQADAVYFVNSKEDVIAAGVQPKEAYDESKLSPDLGKVPMKKMDYDAAASLLK
ncbi:MAG: hypothetical protein E7081_06760 [Bacteroidales bacterium]|nr:hypothetical protein [Bacteroidales bacterium]